MPKHYDSIEVKKLPRSEVEIRGTIAAETVLAFKSSVLEELQAQTEIPGFRAGHAPDNLLVARFGELAIFEKAARLALSRAWQEIVERERLETLGVPAITITALAPGNPLGFTIRAAVIPSVTLPDYRTLAEERRREPRETPEVSEKEIDEVIWKIREEKAHTKLHKNNPTAQHHPPIAESNLPPLTDGGAKDLGNFSSLADLRAQIKDNLIREKEKREKERRRIALLEEILAQTETEVPEVLVESELSLMLEQLKEDLARAGLTLALYLKHIAKNEDDLRREWRESAEKRAKLELVLSEIARKEKIQPPSETIQKETEKLLVLHPQADPLRVRAYVAVTLTHSKVIEFLESAS
ncbi:hypothetical protein EPN83_02765 [Patescibacteria group bacterium]|nr:MAG: hypothetical protein EPN83_02765 [Patescibacteria group bacterium]